MNSSLRKWVSALVIGAQLLQPALAVATEYRIPYKFRTPATQPGTAPADGVGDGIVDPGENPTPAQLTLAPAFLKFDLTAGKRETYLSVLANEGTSATTVSGIESTADFSVSSNCPQTLPVGGSCILSVTPTAEATAGAQHQLAVLAPTATAPAFLQLSTDERTELDPFPVLTPEEMLVTVGTELEPGATASGATRLYNVGRAPATLSGIVSSPDFKVSSDCPAILPAGEYCTISATFASYVPKAHTHTLRLSPGPEFEPTPLTFYATVKSDSAKKPALTFDKPSLSFGPLEVGQSATDSAVLSNIGTAPAVLAPLSSVPSFAVQNNCPSPLPVSGQCTVTVTFTGNSAGAQPHYILMARAQDEVKAELFNQGKVLGTPGPAPKLLFSPEGLPFGGVSLGQQPVLRTTMTNAGELAASIKSISVDYGSDIFTQTNDCGATLSPNSSCEITVTFKPLTTNSRIGRLNVLLTNGAKHVLVLSGTGLAASLAAPAQVSFGTVVLPGVTQVQSIGLGNSGNIPLTGLSITSPDSRMTLNYGNCTSTIQPKKGCTITAQYSPDADGIFNSSIQITSENGGTQTVNVMGSAVRLSVTPSVLNFPSTRVGASSANQTVTLTNTGEASAALDSVQLSSGRKNFGHSSTCGATLAAGSSCSISVWYSPTTVKPNTIETHQGALSISSRKTGVAGVSLTGSAWNPQLELSHRSVSAGSVGVGKSATPVGFTVSNPTEETVSITGMSVVDGQTDFGQSNDCGTELAPGARCTVSIQFTPTKAGVRTGFWSAVTSLGTYGLSLNGTGTVTLTLSTSILNFAPTTVGKSSEPYTVIVTNATPLTATFDGVGQGMDVTEGRSDFGQTNNCDKQLPAGASCAVNLQFTPVDVDERTGTWSVVSSFGTSSISLTGTGVKPEGHVEAPGGDETPPITPGDGFIHYSITFLDTEVDKSSAVRNILFTNRGTGPLGIQGISQVSGEADFNMTNNCGQVLQAQSSCTISLLFTPDEIGLRTGAIILLSDTGNYSFDMSGKGTGASGVWSADTSADFGDVAVGASAQRNFTFRNTGTLPAKNISASLMGPDVAFVSNACGTVAAPIIVAAGGSCKVSVKYSPTTKGALAGASLVASGNITDSPATLGLKGNAPEPALTFDATPSGDFGTVTADTPNNRTFVLRNTGKFTDKLAAAPVAHGDGFAVTGGTCASGLTLLTNGTCTVIVTANIAATGDARGTVSVESTQGAKVVLSLSAQVMRTAYSFSGLAGSNTAPPADFGELSAGGAVSAIKYYYLRDDANLATLASTLVELEGDASFTITDVTVVGTNGGVVLNCAAGASSCLAGAPSRAIRVGVKFAPATAGAKSTTLKIAHNGAPSVTALSLSGAGVFSAIGAWSSSGHTMKALAATDTNYGTHTKDGAVVERTFYVRNVGTTGAAAVGFNLTGSTNQFRLTNIQRVGANRNGTYVVTSCVRGGTIASDGLSATPCQAGDIAVAYSYPTVAITVQFTPNTVGSFNAVLTPTTDNGTTLPEAITLTSTGQFNPTGVWANDWNNSNALTTADTNYGTLTTGGAAVERTFYIRNTGTHGANSVGLTLSGDTDQFTLVRVQRIGSNLNGSLVTYACVTGGAVAADGLSSTPCLAGDIATKYSLPAIAVTVRFNPSTVGALNVRLTPSTDNGTTLPGEITLTGTAQFNPTGAWSSTANSTKALVAANTTYGPLAAGAVPVDRIFYVRNVGTNGAAAVGFTLSGDTDSFQVLDTRRIGPNGNGNYVTMGCAAGGVIAADKLSTSPCLAGDVAVARNSYQHLQVTVRFTPKTPGSASVTLTPTTNNGTSLPDSIALTGITQ